MAKEGSVKAPGSFRPPRHGPRTRPGMSLNCRRSSPRRGRAWNSSPRRDRLEEDHEFGSGAQRDLRVTGAGVRVAVDDRDGGGDENLARVVALFAKSTPR